MANIAMNVELARTVKNLNSAMYIRKMMEARLLEISKLNHEFKPKAPKLFLQRLPIYMRRRVASHNPKRLPRHMRAAAIGKGSAYKQRKRLQRKKYRNPKKVAKSLVKRAEKDDRSFLHLWFSKRFKMISEGGILLPDFNTTKNRRMLYRMSKKSTVYFYMPQLKCIKIRYEPENLNSLIDSLREKFRIDIQLSARPSTSGASVNFGTCVCYDSSDGKVLGPAKFIIQLDANQVLLWVHSTFNQRLLNLLEENLGGFKIEDFGSKYEYFRFIGPDGLKVVNKVIAEKVPNFRLSEEQAKTGVGLDPKIELILPGRHRPSQERLQSEGLSIIVCKSNSKRHPLTDIMVPRCSAKQFWFRSIYNKGHLVGGIRDLKTIACSFGCIQFPYTGYPDCPNTQSNVDQYKQLAQFLGLSESFYVVRDEAYRKLLFEGDLTFYNEELAKNGSLKNAMTTVELTCLKRGTPKKGDLVYAVLPDDIQKYVGKTRLQSRLEDIGYGPVEEKRLKQCKKFSDHTRKVIGIIDDGTFALEVGKGKAIGSVVLSEFCALPFYPQVKNARLVLVRSANCPQYRFASAIVCQFDQF